jgi:TPR repeat protein
LFDFGASGYPKDPEMTKKLNEECRHISQLRDKLPYDLKQKGSLNGIEVETKFEQYCQILESQFVNGHPETGMQLFELYKDLDNDKAMFWLRRGAESNPACAIQLANFYQAGSHGLPADKDAFYRWFLHSRKLEKSQAKSSK